MDLRSILFVGLGSFFGGSLRYVLAWAIDRKLESSFPWSILLINGAGSFLIGLAAALFATLGWGKDDAFPLLLSVGMLGGFTTFSTFSLQTLKMLESGNWAQAALNVTLSVFVCLLSVFVGYKLGQTVSI